MLLIQWIALYELKQIFIGVSEILPHFTCLFLSFRVLDEALSCIQVSTRDCYTMTSALSLAGLARQLLSSEAVTSCITQNSLCDCGYCTSNILLSVVNSPTYDLQAYCR